MNTSSDNLSPSARHLIQMAEDHMKRGHFDEALHILTRVRGMVGDQDIATAYHMAYCLWALGRLNDAVAKCDEILRNNPNHVHTLNIKGNALDDLERREDAISCFERAVQIDPAYYEAWNGMGIVYQALGNTTKALAAYERAVEVKPRFYRGWRNKAEILSAIDRHPEAIRAWTTARGIQETEEAMNGLGHNYYRLGNLDEALAAFDRAIEINPASAQAWNNKGVVLAGMERFSEAAECFREAVRIQPDLKATKSNLERITQPLTTGTAAPLSPNGYLPVSVLTDLHKARDCARGGDHAAAVNAILRAETSFAPIRLTAGSSNEMTVLAMAGTVFKDMGQWEEAIRRFERVCVLAKELDPLAWETVGDLCDLGECYKATARTLQAVAVYTAALDLARRIDPRHRRVAELERDLQKLVLLE